MGQLVLIASSGKFCGMSFRGTILRLRVPAKSDVVHSVLWRDFMSSWIRLYKSHHHEYYNMFGPVFESRAESNTDP